MNQYAGSGYDAQYHSNEPVDPEWTESPFSSGSFAQEENPMLGEMPEHPLHVKVVDTQSQGVAPEFTAWATYQLPASGQLPVQLCPHKYHRDKAKIRVNWGTVGSSMGIGTIVAGTPTHVVVPAGAVVTQVLVGLSGADANSLALTLATQFTGEVAAGTTQYDVNGILASNLPAYNATLAATATATGYFMVFWTLTPIIYVANKIDPLTSGALQNVWQFTPGMGNWPDYDGQQPLYAVASVAGISVSVMDESYGTVQ
jgi:hypothetical protein